MVRDEEKLAMATQFRKRGFSYSEIAKICGVSKGTVSNWLSEKAFSKKVKKDNVEKAARENVKRLNLLNKARGAERKSRYAEAIRAAATEFKHYKNHPLFVAGLMVYIASGDRSLSNPIRLSTQDHEPQRIFIRFAVEYLGVDKNDIRFWLLLPAGQPEAVAQTFWSRKIGLPKSKFGKAQFVSSNKVKPLHNGTGNTIIGNTLLKHKLERWIELMLKELQ